jgi:hypothetical protein
MSTYLVWSSSLIQGSFSLFELAGVLNHLGQYGTMTEKITSTLASSSSDISSSKRTGLGLRLVKSSILILLAQVGFGNESESGEEVSVICPAVPLERVFGQLLDGAISQAAESDPTRRD